MNVEGAVFVVVIVNDNVVAVSAFVVVIDVREKQRGRVRQTDRQGERKTERKRRAVCKQTD